MRVWKFLALKRSQIRLDQRPGPTANSLFVAQHLVHVKLFIQCAHLCIFLLSVCLCAPEHVLVSQRRLFMGFWHTMRDCASLCFEPAWEWSLVGELCAWLDLPSLQLLFTSTIATTHYSSPNSLASHIPSTDNYLPPKYALFPVSVCPSAKTCDISSVFDALGHFSNILRH